MAATVIYWLLVLPQIRSACKHSSSIATGPSWLNSPSSAPQVFQAADLGTQLWASLHPLNGALIDPKDQQIVAALQLAFQLDWNGSQMQ